MIVKWSERAVEIIKEANHAWHKVATTAMFRRTVMKILKRRKQEHGND
jgi:hypothetical protein